MIKQMKKSNAAGAAKNERIKAILSTASEALKAEGVKYFLGVVNRDPKAADGGKIHVDNDVIGEDMALLLDAALPTKQDAINLGVWAGQILQLRSKNNKDVRFKKSGGSSTTD